MARPPKAVSAETAIAEFVQENPEVAAKPKAPAKSKFIQIAASFGNDADKIYALDDSGRAWKYTYNPGADQFMWVALSDERGE